MIPQEVFRTRPDQLHRPPHFLGNDRDLRGDHIVKIAVKTSARHDGVENDIIYIDTDGICCGNARGLRRLRCDP